MRRRTLLGAAALLPFGTKVLSAAPPAETISPALIEAAKKEGKVSYYTAMDLSVAEPMAKAFEAKFPGIKVAVERTGAERLFNRLAQETASNIKRCDVVNSSDAAHFITWKREGWLQPYVTVDIAENVAPEMRDPDGAFVNQRTHLSAMAYNIGLVKPEDVPKGFNDLLDPKYAGKLVKGHPGYSGTIMTATHQIARELGWGYFDAIRQGLFCELGRGNVDFAAVADWLRARSYGGWVVVEQDILPGMGEPRESARRNREHLASLGL